MSTHYRFTALPLFRYNRRGGAGPKLLHLLININNFFVSLGERRPGSYSGKAVMQ